MNRKSFIFGIFGVLGMLGILLPARSLPAAPLQIESYKTPTCGCCSAWVEHMAQAGFLITAQDIDQEALWNMKESEGIAPELSSCHTSFIEGWFVEGHVPASDIRRLVSERPDALGLSVPGMPIGSPGMEMGSRGDAFVTYLVLKDGSTEVFARHP